MTLLLIQVVDKYSKESFRLMALAVGKLAHVDQLDLSVLSQQQAEAHATGFELLGLIVLSNHVRPDSRDAILELQRG